MVVNLSRFSQAVALELSDYSGFVPEEVLGGNEFPTIHDEPYLLTLGFYDHYWFSLEDGQRSATGEEVAIPTLSMKGGWQRIFERPVLTRFEKTILPAFLNERRWFGGKARAKTQIRVIEHTPIAAGQGAQLCLIEVTYKAGTSETYLLPLAFAPEGQDQEPQQNPAAIVCNLETDRASGVLYDAVHDSEFRRNLLLLIAKRGKRAAGTDRSFRMQAKVRLRRSLRALPRATHRSSGLSRATPR